MESVQQVNPVKIKSRCAFPDCKKKCAPIVGDCKYCLSKFCSTHRLPEEHNCSQMAQCKQFSFNANQNKLMAEKCVAAKV